MNTKEVLDYISHQAQTIARRDRKAGELQRRNRFLSRELEEATIDLVDSTFQRAVSDVNKTELQKLYDAACEELHRVDNLHRELQRAATELYLLGFWHLANPTIHDETEQAEAWLRLRIALGIIPKSATTEKKGMPKKEPIV